MAKYYNKQDSLTIGHYALIKGTVWGIVGLNKTTSPNLKATLSPVDYVELIIHRVNDKWWTLILPLFFNRKLQSWRLFKYM